jgi:hypothetical protein
MVYKPAGVIYMKHIKFTIYIFLTIFLSTTFAQDEGWYSQRNSSWKDVRLGSTAHTVSSCTIGNYGCAMTCGAMLNQMETGGDASTVTPKDLNTWLINNGGYQYSDSYALLVWSKVAEMDGAGGLIFEGSNSVWNNWSYLDSELAAGRKVIVKVDFNINTAAIEGHWVLVMEKNGESGKPESYKIYDPWPQTYTNRTLSYYYDAAYNNTFFASRSYSGSWNQQSGNAELQLNSQISAIPNPLKHDQSAEVRVGIINSGDAAFSGEIAAAIHDNNGNFLADIERKSNFSLASNQTQTLSFYADSITLAPGTYQLQIKYKPDSGNWDIVPGYTNPVSIQIEQDITDDQYEENDSYETAYNLTSFKNSWLQGIQSDADWYKIFVDQGNECIQIELRFTHDAGDIDLKLFDENNTNLQSSTSSDDNELIECTVPAGNKWYFIKVYYDNAGNTYNLKWESMALPTGALKVTIQPFNANNAGAKWRVDSGLWRDSGFIENGLSTGQHTIEFKSISGWQKPDNRSLQIYSNQTSEVNENYLEQTGNMSVTISPYEAMNAGAKWRINNGNWHNNGYQATSLSTGQYLLECSDIIGWNRPDNQTVTINASQTTYAECTYSKQTGSLNVTISPYEAINAGARWRIDNGNWQNSGYTASDLSVGQHTLEFSSIDGWQRPANQTITINALQTSYADVTYSRQTGFVSVTITPADAISAGAYWRVNNSLWYVSGDTASGISVGQYTLEFIDISGWQRPNNQIISVEAAQTTYASAAYAPETGNAIVTIYPQSAVDKGALWRIDSGLWQNTGDIVSNLCAGEHQLTFKTISGWITPQIQTIYVSHNQTYQTSGIYNQQRFSVNISGNGAIEINGYAYSLPFQDVYYSGTSLSVKAIPENTFESWSGSIESSQNPLSFQINSDLSITASFELSEQIDMFLSEGWHMISLPVIPESKELADIFPGVSVAYAFDQSYQAVTQLEPGRGYWIKVPYSRTYTLKGLAFKCNRLWLSKGWHLLGGINASVMPQPADKISVVYGFDRSYFATDVFEVGKAYWVKLREEGELVICN